MVTENIQTYEEWSAIKKQFELNGFSEAEAEWAANNKLDPSDPERSIQITRLLKNRKDKIKFLMKYAEMNWAEAVEAEAETSKKNNEDKGADPLDLFQGESP